MIVEDGFAWNWASDCDGIDRYRLDHLKNMCEEELVKRVEASNAADILRSYLSFKLKPVVPLFVAWRNYFTKT